MMALFESKYTKHQFGWILATSWAGSRVVFGVHGLRGGGQLRISENVGWSQGGLGDERSSDRNALWGVSPSYSSLLVGE